MKIEVDHCEVCIRAAKVLKGMRIMKHLEEIGLKGLNQELHQDEESIMDTMDFREFYIAVVLMAGQNPPFDQYALEELAFEIVTDLEAYRELESKSIQIINSHCGGIK